MSDDSTLEDFLGDLYDAAESGGEAAEADGDIDDSAQADDETPADAGEEDSETSSGGTDKGADTEEDGTEDDTVSASDEKAGKEGQSEAAPEPPKSMTAGEREQFRALPPEAQQLVAKYAERREGDIERHIAGQTQELGDKAKALDTLEEVLSQHRGDRPVDYPAEAKAIGELAALNQHALRDPVGYIHWFAERVGLDLQNLHQYRGPDPQVLQLQDQLQEVQRTLSETQRNQSDAATEAQQREIEKFAENHEFFDDVRDTMSALIDSGQASDLGGAYDKAIRLNDDVWAVVQERERKKQAKDSQLDRARAAKAAKKADPRGKSPGTPASDLKRKPQSLEEELGEIWTQMTG